MAGIAPGNPPAFLTSDLHGRRECNWIVWNNPSHVSQMGEGRIMQEQLSRATHGAVAEDAVALAACFLSQPEHDTYALESIHQVFQKLLLRR